MNALELMKALEESGTGAAKMDAARAVAREAGKALKAMPARALVAEMRKRHQRRHDILEAAGPARQGTAIPPALALAWPEGTLAKAGRIIEGLPADPPSMESASAVYDIDEGPPVPRPAPVRQEKAEPDEEAMPGFHPVDQDSMPSVPGIRQPARSHKKKPAAKPAARAEEEPAAHLDALEIQPAE
jgi:hypothetical protein